MHPPHKEPLIPSSHSKTGHPHQKNRHATLLWRSVVGIALLFALGTLPPKPPATYPWIVSQALAHSDVKMTVPDNEEILDKVPDTISIHMDGKIRLTKAEMQHDGHEALEIDISEYKSFQTDFTLPIKSMGPGTYSISWRALGQDGHPLKGAFQFTVRK